MLKIVLNSLSKFLLIIICCCSSYLVASDTTENLSKVKVNLIYGQSSTWHDGGAALLLENKKIIALASERVGDRTKHGWDSHLSYNHLCEFYDFSQIKEKDCFQYENTWTKEAREFTNHHLYHAASSFYGSGFEEAAILIIDGQGPDLKDKIVCTTLWQGKKNVINFVEDLYSVTQEEKFTPQSIGHFYTAIGAMAGMRKLHEEGKTMGLAAYGGLKSADYIKFLKKYVYSTIDGNFYINPDFIETVFKYTDMKEQVHDPRWKEPPSSKMQAIWDEYISLRGKEVRGKSENISQEDMDIAFAGQTILEEIILGLVKRSTTLTKSKNLCLAGGVALNSTVNGKIARLIQEGMLNNLFIFPAAGDDGQAIGKLFWNIKQKNIDVDLKLSHAYYGPVYSEKHILNALKNVKDKISFQEMDEDSLINEAVNLLSNININFKERVIGWYRGGSELGPRALGHRSILADPRPIEMRDYINNNIKEREWYRPLAPVVTLENAPNFFDLPSISSPFMLIVANVHPHQQKLIPAVTHIDGTARVQTISKDQDLPYYNLVKKFGEATEIPVLLNTSFNGKDEPIVETPEDALRTFIKMKDLKYLIIEKYLIKKI